MPIEISPTPRDLIGASLVQVLSRGGIVRMQVGSPTRFATAILPPADARKLAKLLEQMADDADKWCMELRTSELANQK